MLQNAPDESDFNDQLPSELQSPYCNTCTAIGSQISNLGKYMDLGISLGKVQICFYIEDKLYEIVSSVYCPGILLGLQLSSYLINSRFISHSAQATYSSVLANNKI